MMIQRYHLYKYYVYGKDNERITWVDEGLAQFFSGQKDDLRDYIFQRTKRDPMILPIIMEV